MVSRAELPTLLLIALCYGVFGAATYLAGSEGGALPMMILALVITLYSSLQHEVIHGHPFRKQIWNDALVFPAFGLFVPYLRFKETHLAHHFDPNLTDPYEDPETNFVDVLEWNKMSFLRRLGHKLNTTLLGRMTVGPIIGLGGFFRDDFEALLNGEKRLVWHYVHHLFGVAIVLFWLVTVTNFPVWLYVAAAYLGMSILRIRTYLEHQAHERAAARSVIIEDRGLLAFLFLNNNFHAVHHSHPRLVWHQLPKAFERKRAHFLKKNDGYYYRSYWSVFKGHFVRPKDGPVHPLWSKEPESLRNMRMGK